jgi:DNA polymerase III alpha subunit
MHRLDAALALGEQNSKANETGQHDIFGLSAAHVPKPCAPPRRSAEWTDTVRLRAERETLGRAISGHPIDRFVNDLPRFITGRIVDYIDADKPAAQRRRRPRVFRRQAGGDCRRGRRIAQARPRTRSRAG